MAMLQEIKGIIHKIVQNIDKVSRGLSYRPRCEAFAYGRYVARIRRHYVVVYRGFVVYF